MNYIKQSIWAFAAIALVACSSDDDKDTTESLTPVENTSTSFSATIETGNSGSSKATRTSLITDADVPYPVWSTGDQLHIYNATTPANALFGLKSEDYVGQRQGVFDGTITKNAGDKFFALYCSTLTGTGAPTLTASNGSATISATIPATQSTTPGFHPDLHFMTACTTGSTFKLKNAMSLIKINIADNNYDNFKICKIRFKANKSSEKIAGDFTATIGDDGTLSDYTVTNGSNEIVIDGGVNGLSTGTYYIAVLPCAFSEGFTLSFVETGTGNYGPVNGKTVEISQYDRIRNTAFNVDASEIINLGTYTAKECAKEAYVDLGITRKSDGKKVLFCVENVYDDNANSTVNASYYSWGETTVKANQTKEADDQNYSWYYSYGFGQGPRPSDINRVINKRSYRYGVGCGSIVDAVYNESRYSFPSTGTGFDDGVLLRYNSSSSYTGSITSWGGGTNDGETELWLEDDAAYQKSPQHILRIASFDDFKALIENSSVDVNAEVPLYQAFKAGSGQKIQKFLNKTTGAYLLLPYGGYRFKKTIDDNNDVKNGVGTGSTAASDAIVYYWTRNRATSASNSYMARALKIQQNGTKTIVNEERCAGLMLRAVIER